MRFFFLCDAIAVIESGKTEDNEKVVRNKIEGFNGPEWWRERNRKEAELKMMYQLKFNGITMSSYHAMNLWVMQMMLMQVVVFAHNRWDWHYKQNDDIFICACSQISNTQIHYSVEPLPATPRRFVTSHDKTSANANILLKLYLLFVIYSRNYGLVKWWNSNRSIMFEGSLSLARFILHLLHSTIIVRTTKLT